MEAEIRGQTHVILTSAGPKPCGATRCAGYWYPWRTTILWMSWFGMRRARPIRFVFAPEYAHTGSTVMRGSQLAQVASRTPLGSRAISLVPRTADLRRSDVFLTKGALKTVDVDTLTRWRRRGNRLFADPVDEDVPDEIVDSVDVVVAASRTAFDDYRRRWPSAEIAIVDHHVDPRVHAAIDRSQRTLDRPRVGYFGERINTVRSKRIARNVDFVQVSTARVDDSWFDRLPDYNVHYGIRRTRALDQHKPFLKGFTAAACRSLILIQDDQLEARQWLPAEYPFWLRGRVTEPAILESITATLSAYGSPEWTQGLEMMRHVARRTSPEAIGGQLVTLFS